MTDTAYHRRRIMRPSKSPGRRTPALLLAVIVLAALGGCSKHIAPTAPAGVHVSASHDNRVTQNGASLHLPPGSIDRDTTVRISRSVKQPPSGGQVNGFDFDIGSAHVIKTVQVRLPVANAPATAHRVPMLVSFLSSGRWGTQAGTYDPTHRTITVNTTHLSWYSDLGNAIYQLARKAFGEWLGHFRASPPTCDGPNHPELSYGLATMREPPLLACVAGDDNGGSLKVANNRGFYLMITPDRGLTLHNVQTTGTMDIVTGGGGAVIRYLDHWQALPLPPGSTAEFDYHAVAGGPALAFEPDSGATAISAILSLFSGIEDYASLLLFAMDCLHALHDNPANAGECVAQALRMAADHEWIGHGQIVRVAGIAVSRSLLGVLTVVLTAVPEIDLAAETRDDGSKGTMQINVTPLPPPHPTAPPVPVPNPQPTSTQAATPTSPPPSARVSSDLGGIDVERYCQDGWGLHAILRVQNAYGWRCGADGHEDQNVSMDDACQQQYQPEARSRYKSFADPASWVCYIP